MAGGISSVTSARFKPTLHSLVKDFAGEKRVVVEEVVLQLLDKYGCTLRADAG